MLDRIPDHRAPRKAAHRLLLSGTASKSLRIGVFAVGVLVGHCGNAALAQQTATLLPAPHIHVAGLAKAGKNATDGVDLSGFQRRGNTLVGEIKTRDGTPMRLVFDARTHALIGMRVLEPSTPASAPEGTCADHSAFAPLPTRYSPAN